MTWSKQRTKIFSFDLTGAWTEIKRDRWRREILSRSALCALTWSSSWLCRFCWVISGLCLYGPELSSWCLLPQSPDPSLAYSAACYPRNNSHTDTKIITHNEYLCSTSKENLSHMQLCLCLCPLSHMKLLFMSWEKTTNYGTETVSSIRRARTAEMTVWSLKLAQGAINCTWIWIASVLVELE